MANPSEKPKSEELLRDLPFGKEEYMKHVRRFVYALLVVPLALGTASFVRDYPMNSAFEAAGDKYDSSMETYVAPDLWSWATPEEPLVDIGVRTYFRDAHWGHRCMIKQNKAEQVKAMLACFRKKFGRDARVTFCSRSNRTDEEIFADFKAEAERTGKPMRPCTRGDRSPHAIKGNILDIGYGPKEEEDFELIRECAAEQGYIGGYCGLKNDPYHYWPVGGKPSCDLGTYGINRAWWQGNKWLP
jgi:hypothetical protein